MTFRIAYSPGRDAIAAKGWLGAHKWLLLRRLSQLFFLGLFLVGPLTGYWLVKGNLASSLTLDFLPLTDPYVLLQSLVARHWPETTAVTGALIVAAAYATVGGRVYCAWVCPVNPVTDLAHWLRQKLGLKGGARFGRSTRYWLLAATFVVAAATGVIAWELVNPVSMLHRGIVFGFGLGWVVVLAVFLFDLLISNRGWCGHLCPVGAFYSLIGKVSLVRVSAAGRANCNDCMDCYAVCPEPQVIQPALKPATPDASPLILSANCTNCGRCMDVCAPDVFSFSTRFAGPVFHRAAGREPVSTLNAKCGGSP